MSSHGPMPQEDVIGFPTDPIPSLRDVMESNGLDAKTISVAIPAEPGPCAGAWPREQVFIADGKKAAEWKVTSLRELFRGNAVAPRLDRYPEEYQPYFFSIEKHVTLWFHEKGDMTDQQMEELFSLLRRRPDGRSTGAAHDFLWQAAALTLSLYTLSANQYGAIVGRLEQSVRAMAMRPVSRNYASYMHRHCH